MLEPNIFKQRIEMFSGLPKSKQLSPELLLIIDNHTAYYEKYIKAAEDSTLKAYYTLRLTELEKWVKDEEAYKGLMEAIEKVRSRSLIFGTEKDVTGLKNLLNYMGILCEHKRIQAEENLYAMLALIDLIMIEDKDVDNANSENMFKEFKRFFVEDLFLQPINNLAVPNNACNPKIYAVKTYSELVHMVNGKLSDLFDVMAQQWGEDYFPLKASPKTQAKQTKSTNTHTSLLPEWIRSLASLVSSMRRSSRDSSVSTSLTTSTSSNSLTSSSSSSSNLSLNTIK